MSDAGIADTFNWDAAERSSPLFTERVKSPCETASQGVSFTAMFLDRLGTVRYCHADAARLFRAGAHTLVGQHVSELIPDLPFNRRTPGYNIAYATFWAPEGPRHGFCGLDRLGRSFRLQVALDCLDLEERGQIIVALAST